MISDGPLEGADWWVIAAAVVGLIYIGFIFVRDHRKK